MEEGIKDRIILILVILSIIFFISTIGSCTDTHRQKKLKEQEMAMRLDLEEKMAKFTQERKNLEDNLNNSQKALEEEKAKSEATSKALLQEQLISKSLKEELDKVNKLKETLEEDLKEALAGKASQGVK
jgi:uncharacterized protein YlxW (UPF0749 family)